MSLVVEADFGALFLNSKAAVPIRKILKEMGHWQPPMPVQMDNLMAQGVV